MEVGPEGASFGIPLPKLLGSKFTTPRNDPDCIKPSRWLLLTGTYGRFIGAAGSWARSVALGICVGECSALQELVSGELDTWNDEAGQKAACSISAKKFSGLRFSTILPTGIRGNLSSGQVFVASSGSKSCFTRQQFPSFVRSERTQLLPVGNGVVKSRVAIRVHHRPVRGFVTVDGLYPASVSSGT